MRRFVLVAVMVLVGASSAVASTWSLSLSVSPVLPAKTAPVTISGYLKQDGHGIQNRTILLRFYRSNNCSGVVLMAFSTPQTDFYGHYSFTSTFSPLTGGLTVRAFYGGYATSNCGVFYLKS